MQRSVSWTKRRRYSKKAKLYTYLPKKLHYKVTLVEPLLLVAHNSQSLLPHKRYGYKHILMAQDLDNGSRQDLAVQKVVVS
jgi:hypothetical protein